MNNAIAPITITGPVAIAALLLLWWYYSRLNRPSVPRSQRKLRQASIVVMVTGIPLLLVGTSYLDYRHQQEEFVAVWLSVIVLLLVVVTLVILDTVNSMRLNRKAEHLLKEETIRELEQVVAESLLGSGKSGNRTAKIEGNNKAQAEKPDDSA